MRWLRLVLKVLLVLLVAALVAGVIWRSWVVAQTRALVVMGELLDVDSIQAVSHAVYDPPLVEEVQLAAAPTTLVRPRGDGPWPALLFITGADAAGRRQKDVVALADGLARAGFVVYVPDIPGLRDGVLDDASDDVAADVVRAAANRAETRGGQVAIGSVSAGAALALVVAARPDLEGRVSTVAGVAPFADVTNMLRLATTGHYRARSGQLVPYDSDPWMQRALSRSVLASLEQAPGPAADALQSLAAGGDESDPLAPFAAAPPELVEGLPQYERGVVRLLANRDPERFDELYAALDPAIRDAIEQLSPIRSAEGLSMPVLLAAPPKDKYFPLDESRALVDAAPNADLTVTPILDHAIPDASLGSMRDLAAFDGYLVRVLKEAAEPRADG